MDIAALRVQVAAALAGIGLHVYNYSAKAPIPPAAFVFPDSFSYDMTFGGEINNPKLVVKLIAAAVNDEGGQQKLDQLISVGVTGSIVDAIHNDSVTKGFMAVEKMRNYGRVTLPNGHGEFWSAELVLDVYASTLPP